MDFVEIEYRENFYMVEPHSHDHYELYFQLSGTREFFLKDKMFVLPPNCLCVIPPFSLHKTEGGAYERININVSENLLKKEEIRFLKECATRCVLRLDDEYLPVVLALLKEGSALKAMKPKLKKDYELSIVQTILYFLQKQTLSPLGEASSAPPIEESADPMVLKLVFYLNENYKEEITLEKLCAKFFLSKATLCSRFKKKMHCSIMEYLFRVRLNKAKALLVNSTKSIDEISYLCGFSSANYFSLIFKKSIGLSPLNYRKTR